MYSLSFKSFGSVRFIFLKSLTKAALIDQKYTKNNRNVVKCYYNLN